MAFGPESSRSSLSYCLFEGLSTTYMYETEIMVKFSMVNIYVHVILALERPVNFSTHTYIYRYNNKVFTVLLCVSEMFRYLILMFNCLMTFGLYFCFDMPAALQVQFQGVITRKYATILLNRYRLVNRHILKEYETLK